MVAEDTISNTEAVRLMCDMGWSRTAMADELCVTNDYIGVIVRRLVARGDISPVRLVGKGRRDMGRAN